MSLLITSINNKRPMVQTFTTAAHKENWRCYGSDLNLDVPASRDVDALIQLPHVADPDYKKSLLRAVKENGIRLILPSRDGDLIPLAKLKADLNKLDCVLPLPSLETIEICQDKLRFSELVNSFGMKTIPILNEVSGTELLYYTRPRYSSGSKGAYLIKSLEDAILITKSQKQLLHPLIAYPEYTIDVLLDFNSTPLEAVCRRRLRVVDGESKWAQVENQLHLKNMAILLAQKLGLKGHNIIQAFLDDSGNPIFIEANLRFGGASILALNAGLDTATAQIKMAKGEEVSPELFSSINYGLSLKRERVDGEERDFFTLNEAFPKEKNTSLL
ncbi:ATP-grasp domain-containing protein [Curvivirga sp.]|uniref:ATP-grasp domain-containing protein n=1 Tax=Curvivirga sp. TaxID=2856848 RepID=UPI003B5C3492